MTILAFFLNHWSNIESLTLENFSNIPPIQKTYLDRKGLVSVARTVVTILDEKSGDEKER